jgi:hypothetical protein
VAARPHATPTIDPMDQAPKTDRLPEEYLTISEVAGRLKVKPKTIRNKMASGVFRKGEHYFSRPGMGPRFKWSTLVAWLEETGTPDKDSIAMARGYRLGQYRQVRGLDSM